MTEGGRSVPVTAVSTTFKEEGLISSPRLFLLKQF